MLMHVFDWAFRDRSTGRIVMAQWPNLSLWIFITASFVTMAIGTVTPVGLAARIAATVFLFIWAGDEVLRGVNPWRRGLGAAVLIGSLVRFIA
ncbi:hypothetical protein P7D22_12055 [Lichenihabitans sp. Uapishka_5]|nr:hypothetical protein [Lichenihabitans sp. Uapishka_5]